MKHTTHIQQIRHLMNWKESQLTKAAYCRQNGVNYMTFNNWQRKHKKILKHLC